jgi:DNA-directed RNA polymerase subunit L
MVMEMNVVEETNKRLVFELKGEGHTLCNALKKVLWKNKHVKVATYTMKHPLVGIPRMILETDGEIKPRKALVDAAEKLAKQVSEFKKDFAKKAR